MKLKRILQIDVLVFSDNTFNNSFPIFLITYKEHEKDKNYSKGLL